MIGKTAAGGVTGFLLLFFPAVAAAQLSPGELHESHRHLEGIENCTRCHEVGKKLSSERCLACHEILAERVGADEGLHARPEFKECGSCHVDHQGRDYDLVWWKEGVDRFDHRKTGYPLEGGHLRPACRDCHNADHIREGDRLTTAGKKLDRTWLGLVKECDACHRDVHEGELSNECLSCHGMEKWRPASRFDHDRARFALTGKHAGLECGKCHEKEKNTAEESAKEAAGDEEVAAHFRGISFGRCGDCHTDPHDGRLGAGCERCHDTEGWSGAGKRDFDHERTRFPLLGAHAAVRCDGCHRNGASHRIEKFAGCNDCHATAHGESFAGRGEEGRCEGCHTVERFSPSTFTLTRHNETGFPLEGAHRTAPCDLCHRKETSGGREAVLLFAPADGGCAGCHDDPHGSAGGEGVSRCVVCHTVAGWEDVEFDHGTTKFPLDGAHLRAACGRCHEAPEGEPAGHLRFTKRIAPPACDDCHNDRHRGQFRGVQKEDGISSDSPTCDRCHSTTDWTAARFDHDSMASFPLTGAHRLAPCASCHPTTGDATGRYTIYRPLESECRSCHGMDSIGKRSGIEGDGR